MKSSSLLRTWYIGKGITVLDALLGEAGAARSAGSRADRSVYATVRRYRRAAQNVETDRTFLPSISRLHVFFG